MIIIAAIGSNNEIGYDNSLPWKLSGDLKNFKEKTTNGIVIMGSNTFDSIGKPLPNRINIVISSDTEKQLQNTESLIFVESIERSIEESLNHTGKVFVIGGASIYTQFLTKHIDLIDTCYLTHVHTDDVLDVHENMLYFPEISSKDWTVFNCSETFEADAKNEFDYQIVTYSKKK